MRHPYDGSATADDITSANKRDPIAAEFIKASRETLDDEAKNRAFGGGETFHPDEFGPKTNRMPKEVAVAISGATLSVTGLLFALTILVVSPLMTRGLTPQTGVNASKDQGDRNSSRVAANGKRAPAEKPHPGPAVQSEARLVLKQGASYAAADSIPLGIRIDGKADGLALEISNLPSGTTITSGRPLGPGVWRILAGDLGNAVIHPPPGFSGTIDLAIELRRIDDTVIARRSLRIEWPQKPTPILEPIESVGVVAAAVPTGANAPSESFADKGAAATMPRDQIAGLAAIAGKGGRDTIELLIGHSEKLLSESQVEAARLLLMPAAEAHDARAALALGATYDPIMLAIFQAPGVAADVSMALDWYKKAREFGSQKAEERLNAMTAALTQSKFPGGIVASDGALPKVTATPMARPKGYVTRAPTHQHRSYDVAGVGADPLPLLSPPAFIQ